MRKYFKYVLTLLLFIPVFILADMGGPAFPSYEAYVSAKDGASLYSYNYDSSELEKTDYFLEYKTEIVVNFEEKINNDDVYAVISYKGSKDEYEEEYYINLNKISIYKKEYTLDDYDKDDFDKYDRSDYIDQKIIVIKNTNIYYGPSIKYEIKHKDVAVNNEFNIYAIVDGWYYVKNDNYSGWISDDECIAINYGYKYWFLDDANTYDSRNNETVTDVVIPKDSVLNNIYSITEEDDDKTLYWLYFKYNDKYIWVSENTNRVAVKYNYNSEYVNMQKLEICPELGKCSEKYIETGTFFSQEYSISINTDGSYATWNYIKTSDNETGWINYTNSNEYLAYKYEDSLYFVDDIPYYEEIDGDRVDYIEAGTIIKDPYYFYEYNNERSFYYLPINNKYYFVETSNEICEEVSEYYGKWKLGSPAHLYNLPNGEKSEDVLPAEEEIWFRYNYYDEDSEKEWYYASNGSNSGWIVDEEEQMQELKEHIEQYEQLKKEANSENSTVTDSKNTEPNKIKFGKKLTKKETIIIGVLCSVILALVIVVIIILVNKKKKAKPTLEEEKKKLEEEKQKVEDLEKEIEKMESEDLTKDDAFSKTIKLDKSELNKKDLTSDDAFSKTVQLDVEELQKIEEQNEEEDE